MVYLEGVTPTPLPTPIIYNVNFFNIIGYIVLLLCCIDIICSHPSYTIPNILFSIVTTIVLYVSHTMYLSSHTLPVYALLVYICSLSHTQMFLYHTSYKISNTVLNVMYFNVQLDICC